MHVANDSGGAGLLQFAFYILYLTLFTTGIFPNLALYLRVHEVITLVCDRYRIFSAISDLVTYKVDKFFLCVAYQYLDGCLIDRSADSVSVATFIATSF